MVLLEISDKLVTKQVAARLGRLLVSRKLLDEAHYGFLPGGNVGIPLRILTTLLEINQRHV